jgi:hypothetical protein
MSEWWTYSLSDFLLFSSQTYYRLFELYNKDIWPLQLPALALGAAVPVLMFRNPSWQGRAISAILAAAWLWVAWAYHLQRYANINWAATYFAIGFAIEALLLVWAGIIRGRLAFRPLTPMLTSAGLGIFLFALILQPLISPLLGRKWAEAELFGIAPDPTVIATLGILLLAVNRSFWALLIIPILWCAISGAILWTMGSVNAFVAPLAAFLAVVFALRKTFWLSKQNG